MTVIGITGASGAMGRRTTEYVLDKHPAKDVVLFTRAPELLAEFADKGVRTRQSDFDLPETLVQDYTGVDVLLLISTTDMGRRTQQQASAIRAAADAGVSRIVYTSMPNPFAEFPQRLAVLAQEHADTERALQCAGPAWTVLRNAMYFEALSLQLGDAGSAGTMYSNRGAGRHAPVWRDDCAAAAAAVLLGDGHDNAVYDITGPQILDDQAIADILAGQFHRDVTVNSVTDEQWAQRFAETTGLPEPLANTITGFGEAIRAGLFETPTGDTEKLIGRPTLDLGQFLVQ
jgi:NAD(P)H dehydrogenase (quinone)